MDREQLKKLLEEAGKNLNAALSTTATTDEQRAAQDKAIKDAQDALKAFDTQIAEAEKGQAKIKMADAEREHTKKQFADMRADIATQQAKVSKLQTQLEKYRNVEKGHKAGTATAEDFKKAGAETGEFLKDAVKSMGELGDKFKDFFKRSDEKKNQNLNNHGQEEENPDKKNWFDKIGGKGAIGGIIGALLAFMVGKAFGGGIIGKLASFALAFAGFFMGRNFADKHFGGSKDYAKNTPANDTNPTKDVAAAVDNGVNTPANANTVTNNTKANVEVDPKIAEAYLKGMNSPVDNGPKDVRRDETLDAPTVPFNRFQRQAARQ